MAEVRSSMLRCPVCAKAFTETGDHVAKLLSCTHTICGDCIAKKLSRSFDNSLECPICDELHVCAGGVQSISENPYIPMLIKQQCQEKKSQCPVHDKELSLFCNKVECQQPICALCLKHEHKNHDFDDIQEAKEKKFQVLMSGLESPKANLKSNSEMLTKLREENDFKSKACKAEIEVGRVEAIKRLNQAFENLTQEVNNQKLNVDRGIDDAAERIHEYSAMVDNIEKTATEETRCEGLSDKLGSIKGIRKGVNSLRSGLKHCKYPGYAKRKTSGAMIKKMCGFLTQNDFQLKRAPSANRTNDGNRTNITGPAPKKLRTEATKGPQNSIHLNSTVVRTVATDFKSVHRMCLLFKSVIAVCEAIEDGDVRWRIVYFNLQDGKILGQLTMTERSGFDAVTVYGQVHLVIASGNRLSFRRVGQAPPTDFFLTGEQWDIKNVCKISPAMLACVRKSRTDPIVQLILLDCNTLPPRVTWMVETASHEILEASDMCCVQQEDKTLFVAAHPTLGLFAYNARTGIVEWTVKDQRNGRGRPCKKCKMRLSGVTADSCGILFASDLEAGIHVVSSDGRHLGMLPNGDNSFVEPKKILWCQQTSSLVVAHSKGQAGHHNISVFNVKSGMQQ